MIFLNYVFVFLFVCLIAVYRTIHWEIWRKLILAASGCGFLYMYGGTISIIVVGIVLTTCYVAGLTRSRLANVAGIVTCAGVLIYYKYMGFILKEVLSPAIYSFHDELGTISNEIVPITIPLGLSFFTFEFIHYLVDVRRGRRPITNPIDFLCFGLFWPTMVAGPIKRYEQFIPALHHGIAETSVSDLAWGIGRVSVGLAKKWAADNFTGWITQFEGEFSRMDLESRWLFLAALSARILLDFSGYSDIAIGFARMFGIRVPENFNWPYLARSPADFWQRWHMSLSSWIRDYIYIPLGGNRLGPGRRTVNGLTAMLLCGLWHGPHWNFAIWGVYHGIGLVAGRLLSGRPSASREVRAATGNSAMRVAGACISMLSWAGTMLFVCIGWLLFFYPPGQAVTMASQLFVR